MSLRVDEALAGDSVHKGRHSHPSCTEVWVGLPFSQTFLHCSPLLPLAHHPAAPRLIFILGPILISQVISLQHNLHFQWVNRESAGAKTHRFVDSSQAHGRPFDQGFHIWSDHIWSHMQTLIWSNLYSIDKQHEM